jgi:hypothetical protein
MQAHVRNDVKPSVGRVVTLDWMEWVDVSSIAVYVVIMSDLDCQNSSYGDTGWISHFNRIPVISVFAVRVTPIFTNKKHALNTLKMGAL